MKKPLCLVLLVIVLLLMTSCVLDNSAFFTSDPDNSDVLIWNDTRYVRCDASLYGHNMGKALAATADGEYTIFSTKEDSSLTFVLARMRGIMMDTDLFVHEGYTVPTSGDITVVFLNGKKFTDESLCEAIAQTISGVNTKTLVADDELHRNEVCIAYQGCPIGIEDIGWLAEKNGTWYITKDQLVYNVPGNVESTTNVVCKAVPAEYDSVIERYFE